MKENSPDLLVHWDSRWRGFATSFAVALRAQKGPKGPGIRTGARPAIPAFSIVLHLVAGTILLALAGYDFHLPDAPKIRPAHQPDQFESVIYFGPDLPELRDSDGAAAGANGRPQTHEARAPEVIRVVRAPQLKNRIVDAPPAWLTLPVETAANLVLVAPSPQRPAAPPSIAPKPVVTTTIDQPVRTIKRATAAPRPVAPPSLLADRGKTPNLGNPSSAIVPTLKAAEIPVMKVPPIPAATREIRHVNAPSATSISPTEETSTLQAILRQPPPPPPPVKAVAAQSAPSKPSAPPAPASGQQSPPSAPASREEQVAAPNGGVLVALSAAANDKLGIKAGGPGSLALSPSETKTADTAGVSTGPGHEPSKGITVEGGSGRSENGRGLGLSIIAVVGTTPGPGTGGTGDKTRPSTGVTISGSEVYLPSFGTAHDPSIPTRGPQSKSLISKVMVVATGSSGGGLDPRFAPHGARVYTIYLQTGNGSTVMQFAGGESGAGVDLTPPAPVTTEIPPGLKLAPMVISFVLDRTGRVRDLHVLEAHDASLAAQGIAALSHWLFRPALRAGEPLAVNAVIGFGIRGN